MPRQQNSISSPSLETYYAIEKEYEKLWDTFAKACGLSPAEFGILLALRDGLHTQAKICEELSMAKQTANSAIKKLCKKELVQLRTSQEDLRAKEIRFTKNGEAFAKQKIDAINDAEQRVWTAMTAKEREELIRISRKYNRLFEKELKELLHNED